MKIKYDTKTLSKMQSIISRSRLVMIASFENGMTMAKLSRITEVNYYWIIQSFSIFISLGLVFRRKNLHYFTNKGIRINALAKETLEMLRG